MSEDEADIIFLLAGLIAMVAVGFIRLYRKKLRRVEVKSLNKSKSTHYDSNPVLVFYKYHDGKLQLCWENQKGQSPAEIISGVYHGYIVKVEDAYGETLSFEGVLDRITISPKAARLDKLVTIPVDNFRNIRIVFHFNSQTDVLIQQLFLSQDSQGYRQAYELLDRMSTVRLRFIEDDFPVANSRFLHWISTWKEYKSSHDKK
jgi:hypothetical protein